MSESSGIVRSLVARVTALLPEDWRKNAGKWFRQTAKEISEFAERNELQPHELAQEAVELGRTKLTGLANREYAAAVRDFSQSEKTKIETELERRSIESKVRKEEAEADLSQLKVLDAKLELVRKMNELGVILREDRLGVYTAFPLPSPYTLELPEKSVSKLESVDRKSGSEWETMRHHRRVIARIHFRVEWKEGAVSQTANGTTVDVSPQGCLAVVGAGLPMNQTVHLTVAGSGRVASAKVVWRDHEAWDVGLKLDQPDDLFWGVKL